MKLPRRTFVHLAAGHFRFTPDSVAKLDVEQLACNIRIEAREFLN
jgi:hypothetical protein